MLALWLASGRSAPRRLQLGGAPPRWALLCALARRGGGGGAPAAAAGRGGGGQGRRRGADPVGGADGTVLDGLVLGAAGDRHLLAALVFVGDLGRMRGEKKKALSKLERLYIFTLTTRAV